ncbi:hypothetical protein [Enterococcus termitis]|uniref:Uncharacterized protein n=1 Tax=Enterococcus termitis TaxID=332950 RepID=A0A1E5GVU8_9ENTE|nr:hypothetical protein [Enterococcus termitis]OEG16802.1 hypothetical protein BCR25_04185 [Enterococcus termitis]OJG99513.1 hypothetical protein RV18_GL001581 [Enterococcus termitis]
MNKFRIRKYIRQFLKENKDSDFICLNTAKLSNNQFRVAYKMMSKTLLESRRKKQSVFISDQ